MLDFIRLRSVQSYLIGFILYQIGPKAFKAKNARHLGVDRKASRSEPNIAGVKMTLRGIGNGVWVKKVSSTF